MEMISAGTGSHGNCTIIHSGCHAVLVDCGISCRRIMKEVQKAEISPTDIEGVLITHEHSDHISGLRMLLNCLDVPVYASRGTVHALQGMLDDRVMRHVIPVSGRFAVGGFEAEPFPISHDAAEPTGFCIDSGSVQAAVCTDLGIVTDEVRQALCESDLILLESNHDRQMLEDGPYPSMLKHRIAGKYGHLSNEDSALLLTDLIRRKYRKFIMGHRSETNDTQEKVEETVFQFMKREGMCPGTAAEIQFGEQKEVRKIRI